MNKEQLIALGLTKEQADKVVEGFSQEHMVPKSRLDDKIQEVKDLQDQLENRDKDLKQLKKDAEGNEDLQKQYDDLQKQYKEEKAAFEAKLKDTQLSSALKLMLSGDVHDADLVSTLLDKTKIELDENGNVKAGLKEQLEALRESKAFLFVKKEEGPDTKLKGFSPADGKASSSSLGKNPFSKEHFNLTEQGRLFRENPDLYKQLKAQAEK